MFYRMKTSVFFTWEMTIVAAVDHGVTHVHPVPDVVEAEAAVTAEGVVTGLYLAFHIQDSSSDM